MVVVELSCIDSGFCSRSSLIVFKLPFSHFNNDTKQKLLKIV